MKIKTTIIFLFFSIFVKGQLISAYKYYFDTYKSIESMLSGADTLDFQRAVFSVENAYFENQLDKDAFDNVIYDYSGWCRGIMQSGNIQYPEKDTERAAAQCAVFVFMTDTLPFITPNGVENHLPFRYNFDDFAGQKDWSNQFVSTLMETKKGNCHSLPYLYKMIMDKLGYKSYLALSPNHIYIKAQNNRTGWYNIELTCGEFPTDGWFIASGYIHLDALRNGIYMDTLSQKKSVALCLVDLAHGYRAKFGVQDGSFILKCCETALKHFPNYINALLLTAETTVELYQQNPNKELLSNIENQFVYLHQLGYRKMPSDMYLNWLNSMGLSAANYMQKSLILPPQQAR